MRVKCLAWMVLAAAVLPLAAQNPPGTGASPEYAVFAPFVSRLQGEVKNNLVRLTWTDSPNVRGPVFIYRSSFPFVSTNEFRDPFHGPFHGPTARPVEIPYGQGSFVDELEIGGSGEGIIHYFIAASDETGRRYEIPIDYTNMAIVRVSADGSGSFAMAAAGTSPDYRITEAARPGSGISSLEAAVQGGRVILTFTEDGAKNAAVYRSVRPIRQTQDLLGAVILATKTGSPYTDNPVPGIPYYYAVIPEDDLVRGTLEIIPGQNTTRAPVTAGSAGPEPPGELRTIPLPQLSAQAAVPGISAQSRIPPPVALSPQAAMAVGTLPVQPQAAPVVKGPRVFTRDLEVSAAGEEYALGEIIRGPFSARNWEAAKNGLVSFLALPRTPETRTRARFYLGQCWYFLRQPREGLFEFLAIQDRYPAEAMEWIQASLDMLKN